MSSATIWSRFCWGSNDRGQLGTATGAPTVAKPVAVPLADVTALAAGGATPQRLSGRQLGAPLARAGLAAIPGPALGSARHVDPTAALGTAVHAEAHRPHRRSDGRQDLPFGR
ncbi:MAG: hypothetical protein JRI68_02785 [Deltaproteobacteria bacterium]|nr:hypothetical protein [Deltaproteobacteria bacterium]